MNPPLKFRRAWLGLLGTLGLAGCIEFAEQTMTVRYDRATDTLLIHQNYTGIFGEDSADATAGLSAEEQAQLLSILTREQTFFFDNWIGELDLDDLRERAGEKPPPDETETEREARRQAHELFGLLVANTTISSGPFHLDAQQRLCGAQRVTVRRLSAIVRAVNAAVIGAFRAEAADETSAPERRAFHARALAAAADFVRLEDTTLHVRVPLSEQNVAAEKAHAESDEPSPVREFLRQGGQVAFEPEALLLTFDFAARPRTTFTLPVAEKPYRANAVEFVRAQFGIATAFDPAAEADRFLARPAPAASGAAAPAP